MSESLTSKKHGVYDGIYGRPLGFASWCWSGWISLPQQISQLSVQQGFTNHCHAFTELLQKSRINPNWHYSVSYCLWIIHQRAVTRKELLVFLNQKIITWSYSETTFHMDDFSYSKTKVICDADLTFASQSRRNIQAVSIMFKAFYSRMLQNLKSSVLKVNIKFDFLQFKEKFLVLLRLFYFNFNWK